jgi:hypothetical protein
LERVHVRVDDRLGGLQPAAAGEDGEAGEEASLVAREKLVRPRDRGAKRLLARLRIPTGAELETVAEPFQDLCCS